MSTSVISAFLPHQLESRELEDKDKNCLELSVSGSVND